jgi:hypothetical protein
MKTHTFIQKHGANILNMDGNLDQAVITLQLKDGRLAFYWFDEGKYTRRVIKE